MSGAALAALFIPSIAIAQQAQQNIQLETIVVEGEQNQDDDGGGSAQAAETGTGPVNGYVATKSTTGSKTDTPITAIPQSVSVIGRDEIDDRKALKVDEALRYTSGVSAGTFGPDPDTDWFFIRGFQATQTGVFLDGLPLYSFGFGGFQIDPFVLERIEVLKGPASVLYGGGNPGGIISMVGKRPTDEPFGYVEMGVNNWGNAYTAGDFGGVSGENDQWRYRLISRFAGGDQFTDYSEDFRGTVMPEITWQPTDTTSLTAYAQYSKLDQIHIGGGFLPYVGTVVNAPFGKIDREAFFGEPDIDNQEREQILVGYEFEHAFDSWTFHQNARYGRMRGSQIGPYGNGYFDPTANPGPPDFEYPGNNPNPLTPDNLMYRIGFEENTEVNTFLIDNRVDREFETGWLNHSVLLGVDYKYFNIDHIQASGGGTPISVTDPIYGEPQGPTSVYLNDDLTQHQIGLYAQDQMRFGGGWLVTLNGRYDFVETEQVARTNSFSPNYSSDDGEASGRFGLAYEFDNGVTPYFSAATFFNPVIGASGTPFVPETGHQFEAGVKYRPTFVDALITASVFDITRQNVVSPVPGSPTFASTQIGEVTSTGFEIEGKANITPNLKVLATFTAYDLEITKDNTAALIGNTPFVVPEVMASLWLDYGIKYGAFEGVSIGGGLRYQGESWVDNENTLKVPDATVFDAAIRYEKDDWGVALNVTNLFDKEYVKSCQGISSCGYGDSRTITLSAHYKW